jgi:hypothetical protein
MIPTVQQWVKTISFIFFDLNVYVFDANGGRG